MDNQDIRTLKILEEIEGDHAPSQRDMARKLNVSLGLVNSFIKRLANKGYFKVSTFPANRVKYILTPKGAAEKTRLTFEYIEISYQYYKGARVRLRKLFDELSALQVKRVVFYGVSDLAEIAYISLQETSLRFVAVVDDRKAGERFLGQQVRDSDELESLRFDRVLITDMEHAGRIREKILAKGFSQDIIVMN